MRPVLSSSSGCQEALRVAVKLTKAESGKRGHATLLDCRARRCASRQGSLHAGRSKWQQWKRWWKLIAR